MLKLYAQFALYYNELSAYLSNAFAVGQMRYIFNPATIIIPVH